MLISLPAINHTVYLYLIPVTKSSDYLHWCTTNRRNLHRSQTIKLQVGTGNFQKVLVSPIFIRSENRQWASRLQFRG